MRYDFYMEYIIVIQTLIYCSYCNYFTYYIICKVVVYEKSILLRVHWIYHIANINCNNHIITNVTSQLFVLIPQQKL